MKKILSIIATSLLWVSSAEAGVPLIQEQGNSRYTIQYPRAGELSLYYSIG